MKKINISSSRVMIMLVITLVIMLATSGIAVVYLNKIGVEIAEIAEIDLPLIRFITEIESSQLEQAINFERALRHGLETLTDSDAMEKVAEAEHKFESFNEKIEEALKGAELIAEEAGHKAATAESKAEFREVSEQLKKIEEEHKQYHEHVLGIFALINEGEIDVALEKAVAVEKEEEELDHEIETFLRKVEAFTEESALKAEHDEQTALLIIIIAAVLGILLELVMGIWISRTITGPIKKTVEFIQALGQGDLTNRFHMNRKDEIGVMANAFDDFVDNLSVLVENIRGKSTEVSNSSTSLTDISNVLAAGSEENAVQANNVSSAAEQLDSNVTSVATAVEEMSATIKEITGTVGKSSQTTEQAMERSNKAGEVVRALSASSDAIGRITELISSIAAQTNILALNATIEAARAGDAGKGFAVVANEVKDLAKETSQATEEIVAQIGEMQSNARDAVTAIDEIGTVMGEVNSYAAAVSAAIEEQAATTAEIARNMNEAATGVKDIVNNVTGVADSAAENSKKSLETKSAADSLTNVASGLATLVAAFKTGNGGNGGSVNGTSHADNIAGTLTGDSSEAPAIASPEEAVAVADAETAAESEGGGVRLS